MQYQSKKYGMEGQQIKCPLCQGELLRYYSSLGPTVAEYFRGRIHEVGSKHVLGCEACGCQIWFSAERGTPIEIIDCLNCGFELNDIQVKCPKCGWSYCE